MLTNEELKNARNNVMTIMENRIMQMTNCDRATANLVANEVLDLDRESDQILKSDGWLRGEPPDKTASPEDARTDLSNGPAGESHSIADDVLAAEDYSQAFVGAIGNGSLADLLKYTQPNIDADDLDVRSAPESSVDNHEI